MLGAMEVMQGCVHPRAVRKVAPSRKGNRRARAGVQQGHNTGKTEQATGKLHQRTRCEKGKHLPPSPMMHTVKAKVQPPYALYMWCMLAWKCRKSMLSEWGRGEALWVQTSTSWSCSLQLFAYLVTHTFRRIEADKARAPSDVHNGDGGDDTVVHSAGQPSGPAHSSDKQQRTAHTALWSLHNARV
jgi:hypothetical protein